MYIYVSAVLDSINQHIYSVFCNCCIVHFYYLAKNISHFKTFEYGKKYKSFVFPYNNLIIFSNTLNLLILIGALKLSNILNS